MLSLRSDSDNNRVIRSKSVLLTAQSKVVQPATALKHSTRRKGTLVVTLPNKAGTSPMWSIIWQVVN